MYQEHSSPVLREFIGQDSTKLVYGEICEARKTQSFKELLNIQRPDIIAKKLKLKGLNRLTEGDSLAPEDSIPLTNESCSPKATGTPSFVAAPTSLSEYFQPTTPLNTSLTYLERLRMSHQKVIEYRPMENPHISEHEDSCSSALFRNWGSHKNSRVESKQNSRRGQVEIPDIEQVRIDVDTPESQQEPVGEPESSIAEVGGKKLDFSTYDQLQAMDTHVDHPVMTFQKQSPSSGCFIFPAHNQSLSPEKVSPTSPSPPARSPEAFSQSQERYLDRGECIVTDSTKVQDYHLDSPKPYICDRVREEGPKLGGSATRIRDTVGHRPSYHQENILKLTLQNDTLMKQNEKLKAKLSSHELILEENAFLKKKVSLLSRTLKLLRKSQTHSSHGFTQRQEPEVDVLQKHLRPRLSNQPRAGVKPQQGLARSRSALALTTSRPASAVSSGFLQQRAIPCSTTDALQGVSSLHTSLIQAISQGTSPRNTVVLNDERLGHYFTTTGPIRPARKPDTRLLEASSEGISQQNHHFTNRLQVRLKRHQLELNNLLNVQPNSSPVLSTRHEGTKITAWPNSTGCPRAEHLKDGCGYATKPIRELLAAAARKSPKDFGSRASQAHYCRKNISMEGIRTSNPDIPGSRAGLAYTASRLLQNRSPKATSQTKPSMGQIQTKPSLSRTQTTLGYSSPRLAQIEMHQVLDASRQAVGGISSMCAAGTRSTLLQLIKSRGTRVTEAKGVQKHPSSKELSDLSTNPRFHSALLRRSQLLGLSK